MPRITETPPTETPRTPPADRQDWIVEFNIVGFRILRRAARRRDLLNASLPLGLRLRPAGALR